MKARRWTKTNLFDNDIGASIAHEFNIEKTRSLLHRNYLGSKLYI